MMFYTQQEINTLITILTFFWNPEMRFFLRWCKVGQVCGTVLSCMYVVKWLAYNQIQPFQIAKNIEKSTLSGKVTGVRIPYAPFPKKLDFKGFFGIFYALPGGRHKESGFKEFNP